jgi:hypothetical protein
VIAGLVTATLKVKLPGLTGTISPSFVIVLLALVQFSLLECLMIASLVALVQCLWRAKRVLPIQVAFNVAAMVVASAISYAFIHPAGADLSLRSPVLTLIAVAVVQYLGNTLLIAGVLHTVENEPVSKIWRTCYFWAMPYYLVGAAVTGLMLHATNAAGWPAGLLILPCMALVYVSYRSHVQHAALLSIRAS